jgi:hypothetical protein
MDILVLVQIGKLFVSFIREWKLALTAVRGVVLVVILDRILLSAKTAAHEMTLGHRPGFVFLFSHKLSVI